MTADLAVHLPVAAQPSVQTLVDQTQLAEELGYERAWLPETWGRDAVTTMAAMAQGTEEIGIGPSILNIYSRSPTVLAQTAATLQEVADGRVRMGIGPSGPAVIEGWHGESFDRPLRRTRECLEIAALALSGEEVDYDGDVFNLAGFRLRCDPPDPVPAFDAAGMGPKSVELAGRFADGWHATLFTPDGMADRLNDFRRGVDLGNRDRDDLRVMFSVAACALADTDEAYRLARQHLAFYVGAMGTYYRESLARQGYEETANEISIAWASGERDRALEAIDKRLLDDLSAVGDPERAREELRKFREIDGVDEVAVGFPRGANESQIRETMRALAPE